MPTMFESFRRILRGEPVFRQEESDGEHHPDLDAPLIVVEPPTPLMDGHAETHRADGKIAPIVTIQRANCHIHDDRMDLSVVVRNQHLSPVFVDKIIIMGKRWELDRTMAPGETHEFMFYRGGPRPRDTHNTNAELWYRNEAGEYFASRHYVKYEQLHDGLLMISEFFFLPPVRAL